MNIKIFLDRHIEKDYFYTEGSQNENDVTILKIEVPEELSDYSKRIVFMTEDGNLWDYIYENEYIIKNNLTKYETVKAYIWLTKDEEDFRTKVFEISFNYNENADDLIPSEEQIDGFNTLIRVLNEEIEKVKNIDVYEDGRIENEKQRIKNENQRIEDEQIRIENETQRIENESKRLQDLSDLEKTVERLSDDTEQLDRDIVNIDNELTSVKEEITEIEENLNHLDDNKADRSEIPDVSNFVNNEAFDTLSEKVADIELFKFPNVIIHGEPTINNGQVNNFSTNNYLSFPAVFNLHDRGFEFNFAFRTGNDVTTAQNILGSNFCIALFIQSSKIRLRVSSNGTSWDLVDIEGNINIQPNTNYYIQIYFDKLTYKLRYSLDGIDYTNIASKVASVSPFAKQIYLGIGNNFHNPFLGIINLNKCNLKVNKSVIWQGMDDAGLSTRLATDLENIDEAGITFINNLIDEKTGDIEKALDIILGE